MKRLLIVASTVLFMDSCAYKEFPDVKFVPTTSRQSMMGRENLPVLLGTFDSNEGLLKGYEGLPGVWEDYERGTRLLLAPRIPRADDPPDGILFGAIPKGTHEGALLFSCRRTSDPTDRSTRIIGNLYRANATLDIVPVELNYEKDTSRLVLAVEGTTVATFGKVREANQRLLSQVCIIGHRGLSLGKKELANSLRGLRSAWLFGCSGVEIDITVPYTVRDRQRNPEARELKVHHPPDIRSELTGFDSDILSTLGDKPSIEEALQEISTSGIRTIYLDPKLRWLFPEHAKIANEILTSIVETSRRFSNPANRCIVVSAELSEPGQTADLMHDLWSTQWPGEGVFWALEFTKGTNPARFWRYSTREANDCRATTSPPHSLSYNLLRVRASHSGLVGWFLRDLSQDWERRFKRLPQAKIFWTAKGNAQFGGALDAARRFSLVDGSEMIGIITPYPHRLAYYLGAFPLS